MCWVMRQVRSRYGVAPVWRGLSVTRAQADEACARRRTRLETATHLPSPRGTLPPPRGMERACARAAWRSPSQTRRRATRARRGAASAPSISRLLARPARAAAPSKDTTFLSLGTARLCATRRRRTPAHSRHRRYTPRQPLLLYGIWLRALLPRSVLRDSRVESSSIRRVLLSAAAASTAASSNRCGSMNSNTAPTPLPFFRRPSLLLAAQPRRSAS